MRWVLELQTKASNHISGSIQNGPSLLLIEMFYLNLLAITESSSLDVQRIYFNAPLKVEADPSFTVNLKHLQQQMV